MTPAEIAAALNALGQQTRWQIVVHLAAAIGGLL